MTPQRKIQHLQALQKSGGWAVLQDIMRDEIVSLALSSARKPNKTPQEDAFYAGCITAAENLLNVVDNMLTRLDGEVRITEAHDAAAAALAAAAPTPD